MKLNVTFKTVTKEEGETNKRQDEKEKGNKDKRKWHGEREKEGTKEIIRFRNNVMSVVTLYAFKMAIFSFSFPTGSLKNTSLSFSLPLWSRGFTATVG